MESLISDANNVKQQLIDRFATGAVITPSVSGPLNARQFDVDSPLEF